MVFGKGTADGGKKLKHIKQGGLQMQAVLKIQMLFLVFLDTKIGKVYRWILSV